MMKWALVILVVLIVLPAIITRANAISPQEQAVIVQTAIEVTRTAIEAISHTKLVSPYIGDFTLTQGLHGQSYGHLAADIKQGCGALTVSPIDGIVTQNSMDGIGNPTLVIKNDLYEVTMLHGKWTPVVGTQLNAGDPVGAEAGIGNTFSYGVACNGRSGCGCHLHVNYRSVQTGQNLNALQMLGLK